MNNNLGRFEENSVITTFRLGSLLTMLLLNRHIRAIGKLSVLLWIGVLGTLAIVIGAGLPHLRLDAFLFWRAPRTEMLPNGETVLAMRRGNAPDVSSRWRRSVRSRSRGHPRVGA